MSSRWPSLHFQKRANLEFRGLFSRSVHIPKMNITRAGNKQRLLDALRHRPTGQVPFLETYVAEPIVDWVMGRPMGRHMLKLPAPDYIEFLRRTGIDAAYLHEGGFLGRRTATDPQGRVHYVDGSIKSRAALRHVIPPPLDPVRRRLDEFLQAAEGTNLGSIWALDVAPTVALTAVGPTDFFLAMVDAPDFVDELMDRIEAYTLPLIECVLEYPVDVIFVTGPMCGKTGLVVSREMHDRFIFPRLEKILRLIAPRDVPVILHTDGDNSELMDWILSASIAGLHPIEPSSPRFDIYDLKARYGRRLCLCGNVDVGGVLASGTPDQVHADTLEHLQRLAPGGGYICGSSHDITENIPAENFRMLARTICEYRFDPADESVQLDNKRLVSG